jgi:hypothetical protein
VEAEHQPWSRTNSKCDDWAIILETTTDAMERRRALPRRFVPTRYYSALKTGRSRGMAKTTPFRHWLIGHSPLRTGAPELVRIKMIENDRPDFVRNNRGARSKELSYFRRNS